MRVYAGLSLEKEHLFFSFVSVEKNKIISYIDRKYKLPHRGKNFKDIILANVDAIGDFISQQEKRHSFRVDGLFFVIPREYARIRMAEDIVPVSLEGLERKIIKKDIQFAKRQIENIYLELNEYCIHHLVLEYRIGNSIFYDEPLGRWAKNIFLKSMLIFVDSNLYDAFRDCFNNIDLRFRGFVYESIAGYAAVYDGPKDIYSFIVNIKEKNTLLSCFFGRRILFEKFYEFGEDTIVDKVSFRVALPKDLIRNLIAHYVSFAKISVDKEISIKDGDKYFNVSVATINSIVKDVAKEELSEVIDSILNVAKNKNWIVAFLGNLSEKSGFYEFIKDCFDVNICSDNLFNKKRPSFGCVCYGRKPFFEEDTSRCSLWERVVKIYKEYF